MSTFFQKHRRKIMASILVIPAVAIVLPAGLIGQGNRDFEWGHVNGQPVNASEVAFFQTQWRLYSDLAEMRQEPVIGIFAERPELFMAMVKEADRMGVVVTRESVHNDLMGMLPPGISSHQREVLVEATANYRKVLAAFSRVTSAAKLSEPRLQQQIAQQTQQVTLDAVQIAASDYAADLPAPTDDELLAQLKRYGANEPRTPTDDNPHGYGYRLPNRVRVQYITIPVAEVKRIVAASQSEFDWNRQAYRYYLENQGEFAIQQPSILDADTESTVSVPTVRPFEAVADEIREKLLAPQTAQRSQAIADRLQRVLREKYDAAASEAGENGISGEIASFEYLQEVARTVGSEFDITLEVHAPAGLLGASQLQTLPSIAGSSTRSNRTPFATYILSRATPFADESARNSRTNLNLYQPSQALSDRTGNTYYVRIVETDAARAPREDELEQFRGQLEADLRLNRAYEKAVAAAKTLSEQAESSSLESAASQAQLSITKVGPIRFGDVFVPNLTVTAASQPTLIQQAFNLLRQANADTLHPQSLIELPADHRVMVARLATIEPTASRFGSAIDPTAGVRLESQYMSQMELMESWFDPENIVARTGLKEAAAARQ